MKKKESKYTMNPGTMLQLIFTTIVCENRKVTRISLIKSEKYQYEEDTTSTKITTNIKTSLEKVSIPSTGMGIERSYYLILVYNLKQVMIVKVIA